MKFTQKHMQQMQTSELMPKHAFHLRVQVVPFLIDLFAIFLHVSDSSCKTPPKRYVAATHKLRHRPHSICLGSMWGRRSARGCACSYPSRRIVTISEWPDRNIIQSCAHSSGVSFSLHPCPHPLSLLSCYSTHTRASAYVRMHRVNIIKPATCSMASSMVAAGSRVWHSQVPPRNPHGAYRVLSPSALLPTAKINQIPRITSKLC